MRRYGDDIISRTVWDKNTFYRPISMLYDSVSKVTRIRYSVRNWLSIMKVKNYQSHKGYCVLQKLLLRI
jgi:hypothetical protein